MIQKIINNDIKKYYTEDDDLLLNLEDLIEDSNKIYFLNQ